MDDFKIDAYPLIVIIVLVITVLCAISINIYPSFSRFKFKIVDLYNQDS